MASAYTRPNVASSGVTWSVLQTAGWAGHLEKLLAAQPSTPNSAPTAAATATATGGGSTGGALAAGTYFFVATETNGFGETTAGPESSQLTVSAGNIPRVTFPTLKTGNTARNLYFGAKNGSTGGPYTLYARGITAGTYDCAVDLPTDSSAVRPPTANTTALSTRQIELIRSLKHGDAQRVIQRFNDVVGAFLSGKPVPADSVLKHLHEADAAAALLYTLIGEIGALIVANPGTIRVASNPIGGFNNARQWP